MPVAMVVSAGYGGGGGGSTRLNVGSPCCRSGRREPPCPFKSSQSTCFLHQPKRSSCSSLIQPGSARRYKDVIGRTLIVFCPPCIYTACNGLHLRPSDLSYAPLLRTAHPRPEVRSPSRCSCASTERCEELCLAGGAIQQAREVAQHCGGGLVAVTATHAHSRHHLGRQATRVGHMHVGKEGDAW